MARRKPRAKKDDEEYDDEPRDDEELDDEEDEELDDEEPEAEEDEDFDDEPEDEDEPEDDDEPEDEGETEVSAFEEEMHELQEELGDDWVVRFSVKEGEAWLTAEKEDGSQHLEAPTADVLREAVELLDEGGGRS